MFCLLPMLTFLTGSTAEQSVQSSGCNPHSLQRGDLAWGSPCVSPSWPLSWPAGWHHAIVLVPRSCAGRDDVIPLPQTRCGEHGCRTSQLNEGHSPWKAGPHWGLCPIGSLLSSQQVRASPKAHRGHRQRLGYSPLVCIMASHPCFPHISSCSSKTDPSLDL